MTRIQPSLAAAGRRLLAAVAALAAAGLALAVPGRAATAQFAIDKTEMFLDPADSLGRIGVLLVRNEGDKRAQATIKLEDWDRAEDGTNRFFPVGTQAQSCGAGLKAFPRSLNLAPGESQYVRVQYDGPVTAGRECWGLVLVETLQPRTEPSGRMLLYTLRTGLKVYVEPPGLERAGEVADITLRPRGGAGMLRDGELDASVTFENTGTRHLVAKGRLEVRREDNTTAALVELPPAYALPGAKARVNAVLPRLAPGRYVVLAMLDFGGQEIAAAQMEYEAR